MVSAERTYGYLTVLVVAILFLWPTARLFCSGLALVALVPAAGAERLSRISARAMLPVRSRRHRRQAAGDGGFLPLRQAMFFGLAYLGPDAYRAGDSIWVALPPPPRRGPSPTASRIGVRRQGEAAVFLDDHPRFVAAPFARTAGTASPAASGLKGIPGLPGLDDFSAAYYVSATALLTYWVSSAWLYAAPMGVLAGTGAGQRRWRCLGLPTRSRRSPSA